MKRRFLVQTPVRRRVSALAAGVALAAVTAGCQVNSPIQTDEPYVPADGVPADVGQLAVRDLVLVGDGSGPAVFSGSAINLGTQSMTVQFAAGDASQGSAGSGTEVQLSPRQQVDLSTKGLEIADVTGKPGTLVPVTITSSTGGSTLVKVPVLPAAGHYASVTPAPPPAPTTSTPTETATATETATPTDTATPSDTATTTAAS